MNAMTISEQIADLGPLQTGQKLVFVKKIRAAYLVTVDDKVYYRGPNRDVVDSREDVAIVRSVA